MSPRLVAAHAALLAGLLAALLAGCSLGAGEGAGGAGGGATGTSAGLTRSGEAPGRLDVPALQVSTVVAGLRLPWDIGLLPDGRALVTERAGRLLLLDRLTPGARATPVSADLDDVYASGEGGQMGLAVHPDFATSRRFTTCYAHAEGGRPVDVRLVTWTLSADGSRAERAADPLLGGLPLNPSGRHSGCRPVVGPDGLLYVTTGDTADPALPQDRGSLGGKVLRLDLATGAAAPGNPFLGSADPVEARVWTYGHRNVQGVTFRPGDGQPFSAEHGPDVDDEVNRLVAGANYGWDPSRGGRTTSYDESVPMTDTDRFPGALEAVWRTGPEGTEAISGLTFLDGDRWGDLAGRTLAVAALKGQKLVLLRLSDEGDVTGVAVPAELAGTHGRLRSAHVGSDGALYLTTSNGEDDEILRVLPGT